MQQHIYTQHRLSSSMRSTQPANITVMFCDTLTSLVAEFNSLQPIRSAFVTSVVQCMPCWSVKVTRVCVGCQLEDMSTSMAGGWHNTVALMNKVHGRGFFSISVCWARYLAHIYDRLFNGKTTRTWCHVLKIQTSNMIYRICLKTEEGFTAS